MDPIMGSWSALDTPTNPKIRPFPYVALPSIKRTASQPVTYFDKADGTEVCIALLSCSSEAKPTVDTGEEE